MEKRYKLIYLSHWRFPSEKTMSPLIMKTCEGFRDKGFEVELWVPWRQNKGFSKKDPFEYHRIKPNFKIRRLPAIDFTAVLPGKIFFLILLASFNISNAFLGIFLAFKKNTIFYLHDERDAVFLVLFRRPIFIEIHDFYKSSLGFLNRWCFKRITGFIVTNRFKMGLLEKEFDISPKIMLHQPNAVDVKMFQVDTSWLEARKILGLPQDQKIVLYTGHLFGWKGVDTLFDSHPLLKKGEVVYFVGGTDKDIQKFKVKSEKLKVKNVTFVGHRPHREIPLWLRAADVLVLPNTAKDTVSKYETSPVKLFEYMASGTPIVASDLPSIRNVVDERMVTFFTPDDPRSLAEKIMFVLHDREGAAHKGRRAMREVEQYSWERRGNAISKFIELIFFARYESKF